MCDMNEKWRPVKDFEGFYEVSNCGRVRSVARFIACCKGKRMSDGKVLKNNYGNNGYAKIELSDGVMHETALVHRLVAIAFVPGAGRVVRHSDGDKKNNKADNLKWGSYKDNEADKKRHGKVACGVSHGNSVLTVEQIGIILDSHDRGLSQLKIAADTGINRGTIGYLVRGQSYVKEVETYRLAQRGAG